MHKLELNEDDELTLDGVIISAKRTGRPTRVHLEELKDSKGLRALAERPDTSAPRANAYLLGSGRNGLNPWSAIQFFIIERE